MKNQLLIAFVLASVAASLAAQPFPPGYIDPQPVLHAAIQAIGADKLKCVTLSGTGYAGMAGQARLNDKNVDWPRGEPLASYSRTINWEARTMKEEFERKPGLNPASWKYGLGWVGGTPLQKRVRQTFVVNGNHAWHYDGAGTSPVPSSPEDAELWQLDMWLNPHGFLKAAMMPGASPTAVWRWELGELGTGSTISPEKVTVVSIRVLGKYRVDATINKESMLQRIHTWVPDPVLGDMNYEHEFTNQSYVDLGNGVKFPTLWHNHAGWDDNYQAQSVNAGHNGFGGTFKDVRANVCDDPVPVPESVRQATFPTRVEAQRLADGVYLLGGASHNSVAVEFKDFIAVIEAPLNERRNLAVIDAVVKLVPNKPIRFLVNTHQHHDHIGGLRTYMHIGATIITHSKNVGFYMRDVLNYAPRTLQPDMVSLWPPTELAEGYFYEQVTESYVLSDGTRSMNIYYVQPLRHADGMLMAYLPKEQMIIEADLFDTHEPASPSQAAATTSLYNQVRARKLDVSQVVPIHGKPASWKDVLKVVGNTK